MVFQSTAMAAPVIETAPASEVRTIVQNQEVPPSNSGDQTTPEETMIVNFEVQLQLDFKVSMERLEELKDMFRVCLTSVEQAGEDGEFTHPDYTGGDESHVHASITSIAEDGIVFQAESIKPGEYWLNLSTGYYFQDHTQKVVIKEGTKTTLVFSNSYTSNRGEGKTSPGVYALGDLNSDGMIDSGDSAILIEHMGESSTKTEIPESVELEEGGDAQLPEETVVPNDEFQYIYDLNQDGKLDIADLALLVYNMDQEKKDAAPMDTVLKTAVKVEEVQEKAIPQGDRKLDSIMEDAQEPIQIAAAKDEVISESNPVEIAMEFQSATVPTEGIIISAPPESGPAKGKITVEPMDPEDPEKVLPPIEVDIVDEGDARVRSGATAIRKADGSIVVNLGNQVAVKKVTIVVTSTATSTKLTEIAKVEFLNDMESRIPEPEMNIPTNLNVEGNGDAFTVSWDAQVNVTGYEVAISAKDKNNKEYPERVYKAGINQIKIQTFEGGEKDKVTPLWTYYVRVRSTNGEWRSPYTEITDHLQKAAGKPDAPDNVKINGKYRQLDVSWKDMTGTEKYSLEYREKGTEEYIVVEDIFTNAYQIKNLKDNTEYEVRVKGWNTDDNGNWRSGNYSLPAIGRTSTEIPQFSKYNMINMPNPEGGLSQHITGIKAIATMAPGGPGGIDTTQYPEGEPFKPEYISDGDYTTYMHTNKGYPNGADVTFDADYNFKEIIMTNRLEDQYKDGTGYSQVIVEFYDENNQKIKTFNGNVKVQSLHPTAKNSIKFTLPEAVTARRVVFKLSKYGAGALTISELNFFAYDSLEDDVYALYTDDMHIALKEGVTETQIDALMERTDVKDPVSDEYHPKRDLLKSELENARKILNNADDSVILKVKSNVTLEGTNRLGFNGGLSGLQPLGYVAAAGDKINVFVGQKGKNVGDQLPVRLVFAQHNAESSAWRSGEISLYQGMNEITVPEISNLDFEKGGSIYIVQTNSSNINSNPVHVRVSGGAEKIPMLDLHRSIGNDRFTVDEVAWKSTIKSYIEDLVQHTNNLQTKHSGHAEKVGKDYSEENCFLNYTEISLDNVLLSVSASQILKGLQDRITDGEKGDIDKLTDEMYDNVIAFNQMIELFYKQRGLNPASTNGVHGTPTARFNVRYHRMFAGAFMYAGGNHLGIQFGSVSGMAGGTSVVADENGKHISGDMFGWGIAHEMGHNADVGGMTFAETTNNIWSQFEKSQDTANTSRIPYEDVYKHVTSNTVGKSGNVFADLGMYWQLHLAYDKNYVYYNYYKDGFTTENYNTMIANEFFARYYAIRRDWNMAPKPDGIAISGGTTEQNIMRTACAAAQKDLTDFFKAWGWEVDAKTAAYAGQFPKEERKIQYLNDAAREYTLAGSPAMVSKTVQAELEQGTGDNARKVTLTLSLPEETTMDAVLGYEIIRNGKPVAFVQPAIDEKGNYEAATVYEDIVETENNRVMTYEVIAYDKYLNTTEKLSLEPIKIRHEGDLPSDNWKVTTNATSNAGVLTVYDKQTVTEGTSYTDVVTGETVVYNSDMDIKYLDQDTGEASKTVSAATKLFDGDREVGFEGKSTTSTAYIDIDLGGKQQVAGLKFEGGSTKPWSFTLHYSTNGGTSFTRITSFQGATSEDGYPTLYFKEDNNIKAFTATTIRIAAPNGVKSIGIKEIKLVGPSGDNVDIGVSTIKEDGTEEWNTENAIGLLKEDYILSQGTKIPAGSFIVTGQYAGNAAYNVVKLYNEKHVMYDDSQENKLNSIVSGYQTFFAPELDPGENIVNVKNGTWIYYLEPLDGENEGKFGLPGAGENGEDFVVELPKKVYAELYRVNNATTLAGERLVSDSFTVNVPEKLPTITLTNDDSEKEEEPSTSKLESVDKETAEKISEESDQ